MSMTAITPTQTGRRRPDLPVVLGSLPPKEVQHVSEYLDWNQKVIDEFRATGGKIGGQFEGAPVLLINTKGAKSGQQRVSPVMYLDLDGRRYVFASKAGADTNPDWYTNLRANSDVTVEVGEEKYAATAVPLPREQRDRVFAEQAKRYPRFGEYQEKTARAIPVVELTPRA
jgi:deazaflavin-dependent oxidoreductase (nitroreductase family)